MPTDQPNLLFVFSDQHRGMEMRRAGHPDLHTPNMDRLAAEGVTVRNACANAPVCGPSRGCLLTGQYPHQHGVVDNDLPLRTDVPSVGETFRNAGYRTGYIGKWHLDGPPRDKFTPPGSRRQGFDDLWAVYNCSHNYMDAKYYRDTNESIEIDGYEPVHQTDLATEFASDGDDPFCLFLSYGPPHDPYGLVPDEYRQLYDPDDVTLRPNVEPIPDGISSHPASQREPREVLADYYAQITAIDDQLGRLLDHLDRVGIADETIVVYTSDHGDMLWSQGKFRKGYPWEESVRVPFLARWPDELPAGAESDSMLSTVDVAPTLLNLCGLSTPETMTGVDRSATLRGDESAGADSVFIGCVSSTHPLYQQGADWRGVRTDRYTYARLPDGRAWLLYDNVDDPYQRRNRALDPSYETVREKLDGELDRWLDRTEDPFLTGEEHIREAGHADIWNEQQEELESEVGNFV